MEEKLSVSNGSSPTLAGDDSLATTRTTTFPQTTSQEFCAGKRRNGTVAEDQTTTGEPIEQLPQDEKAQLPSGPSPFSSIEPDVATLAPPPPPLLRPASDRRPMSSRPTLASRGTTINSERLRQEGASDLPRLKRRYTKLANKKAHPMEHIGITFGLPMIVLFDIVVPCIIYYTWYDVHRSRWQKGCRPFHARNEVCPDPKPEFDKDILGYAIISFGFGELYILLARVWRLFFRREECAPLLSRNKWELDATSWVYLVAMMCALIPFVVGSTLVIPVLYLYSPAFLMAFLGVLMLITTLHPFNIPIGINSHARGSGLRPFIYYAAEDFIAVDGLQDREFRIRYNERYEASKPFRRMFVYLTLWWELGVCVYIGCLSAVIWTVEFHIAFGLSLGILFSYIACWAAGSYLYVNHEMNRQRKAYEEGRIAA